MNENADWISSGGALSQLLHGSSSVNPKELLHRRLRAGMLDAEAEKYELGQTVRLKGALPTSFWDLEEPGFSVFDWDSGDFERRDGAVPQRAFGVRFRRSQIDGLCDLSVSAPILPNKGGKPAASWWDDFWIEIFRQIHSGELDPQSAVDIQKAMLTWAQSNGHNLHKRYARIKANKLWKAIEPEGS